MKKIINKKRGFSMLELLVVIVIIGILTITSIRTYKNIIKETSESTLKNELVVLEGNLEVDFLNNGFISNDIDKLKKFQKSYYGKKDMFNINKSLGNIDIYYKTDGEDIFCIGYKKITDKFSEFAKNDDGKNPDYIEICNEGRTNLNLEDENNRFILKPNYY